MRCNERQKTVEDRVIELILNHVDPEHNVLGIADITKEARIGELGDSLDELELIIELEEEFDIDIPDSESNQIETVGDAITCVQKILDEIEMKNNNK